jgi:hypothetical protein
MKDRPSEILDESLERLIDAEVDSALAKFKSGDFEGDVRRKIREIPERKNILARLRALPGAVWMAIAAIVFAGGLTLLVHPQKTPGTDVALIIENVLRQTLGSQDQERREPEPLQAPEEISSPLNGQIMTALTRVRQNSRSSLLPGGGQAPTGKVQRLRPMTLEETYRILFIDKSIERALALIS